MEFTDREKKLILIKYIVHGVSPYADKPITKRVQMLKAAMGILGYDWDENELFQLGQEIIKLQDTFVNGFQEFVRQNKDLIVRGHIQMDKGNEDFTGLLGKDFVDDALEILKKGKVD